MHIAELNDINTCAPDQLSGEKCSITMRETLEANLDLLKLLYSTGQVPGHKVNFLGEKVWNGPERNFGNDCGVSENAYNIHLGTLQPCQLFGEKDSITLSGTLESIVDFLKMLNSTGLALGRKISSVGENITNGTERNFGNDCEFTENALQFEMRTSA